MATEPCHNFYDALLLRIVRDACRMFLAGGAQDNSFSFCVRSTIFPIFFWSPNEIEVIFISLKIQFAYEFFQLFPFLLLRHSPQLRICSNFGRMSVFYKSINRRGEIQREILWNTLLLNKGWALIQVRNHGQRQEYLTLILSSDFVFSHISIIPTLPHKLPGCWISAFSFHDITLGAWLIGSRIVCCQQKCDSSFEPVSDLFSRLDELG